MKQGIRTKGNSPSNIIANSDGENLTITIPKKALAKFSNVEGDIEVKKEGIGEYKNMLFLGIVVLVVGLILTN